jgi:hypothetical protein
MDLAEQTLHAEDNHKEAVSALKSTMQKVHPANVAPVLARQAVARDTQIAYLTSQMWMRLSDQGFDDIE